MLHYQYIIINFAMFYGILIGCTSLRVNYKKRQIRQLKIVKVIMYLINFMQVFVIPSAVRINFSHIQLNVKNPLIAYAIALTICMRLTFLLLVIVMKEKRDRQLLKWFDKLWLIQTDYFDRFKAIPADTSLRKFLVIDVFLMLLHCFTLMINLWEMYLLGRFWKFFDIYILCYIINFQHYFLWHHSVLLCLLHECFSKINYQLEHFVMDPKLSLIYYQLTRLVADLNDIYGLTILCIQACLIITNSIVGYVLILYFFSSDVDLNTFSYILGGRLYILLGMRKYLYFRFCERATNTTRKTANILKALTDAKSEIEIISLNLMLTKVVVSFKGALNIDLNSFFSITAQTVLLTIVLVQAELQNKI